MQATNSATIQEPPSRPPLAANDQALPGTLDSILVSYANLITVSTATPKALSWIINEIRCSAVLQKKVSYIRSLGDRDAQREAKKNSLPWFCFPAFREGARNNDSFISTKHILIDCDHIGEILPDVRNRVVADPDVFICFVSPSGDGLKIAFEMEAPIVSEEEYRRIFGYFRELVSKRYGVSTDDDAEPARACFLSSDPSIYVNAARRPMTRPDQEFVRVVKKAVAVSDSNLLQALAGSASPGRTHNATRIIGRFIQKGLDEAETTELLRIWNQSRNTPPLEDVKIIGTVRDMYKRYGDERLRGLLTPYYSYRTEILDVGILGEEFFMEDLGIRKFFIKVNATDKEAQGRCLKHVVKEKHIRHLLRVDHIGDMSATESYFEFMEDQGIFQVHYAPMTVKIQENAFIDSWLMEASGPHVTFIKQWLAVYCYTNYRKLPTLVLKGGRGTGKNTFAESVLSIFPSISQFWHGEEKNFTPEVQKKLLIADESVSANEEQYRMLKQRSGQKMSVVNQKFLPEYQVKNNMNIVILSNEHTPIFVQKDEEPTSVKNNQFFVYTMPTLQREIDPDFGQKIEDRLGHYVRTELKEVYEGAKDIPGCRYTIPTPITEEERALFNVNQTGLEEEAMTFLRRMVEREDDAYVKFFEQGLFPTSFLDSYSIAHGYGKNGVIRNLKEKGWLKPADAVRKMVKSEREYCFGMTDKLKKWYQEQKIAQ